MKPLCSVCALRIWKISSCLRMPVAPPTVRSFAIWVSFWMLMSFRSVMFSRCACPCPGACPGACPGVAPAWGGCGAAGADAGAEAAAFGCSGAAEAAGVGVSCAVEPLEVRAGAWRLGLLGMWSIVNCRLLIGSAGYRWSISKIVGILADRHDAAGDDRLQVQGARPLQDRVAVGAGIQPHLADALARHLVDDPQADVRRDVEGRHVDRPRDVQHRRIRLQPFDLDL